MITPLENDQDRERTLPAVVPENTYSLVNEARSYLFIIGGIGITPILSIIRSFYELLPLPWQAVLPVACIGDDCLP